MREVCRQGGAIAALLGSLAMPGCRQPQPLNNPSAITGAYAAAYNLGDNPVLEAKIRKGLLDRTAEYPGKGAENAGTRSEIGPVVREIALSATEDPDIRWRAVYYLGEQHGRDSFDALREIALRCSDEAPDDRHDSPRTNALRSVCDVSPADGLEFLKNIVTGSEKPIVPFTEKTRSTAIAEIVKQVSSPGAFKERASKILLELAPRTDIILTDRLALLKVLCETVPQEATVLPALLRAVEEAHACGNRVALAELCAAGARTKIPAFQAGVATATRQLVQEPTAESIYYAAIAARYLPDERAALIELVQNGRAFAQTSHGVILLQIDEGPLCVEVLRAWALDPSFNPDVREEAIKGFVKIWEQRGGGRGMGQQVEQLLLSLVADPAEEVRNAAQEMLSSEYCRQLLGSDRGSPQQNEALGRAKTFFARLEEGKVSRNVAVLGMFYACSNASDQDLHDFLTSKDSDRDGVARILLATSFVRPTLAWKVIKELAPTERGKLFETKNQDFWSLITNTETNFITVHGLEDPRGRPAVMALARSSEVPIPTRVCALQLLGRQTASDCFESVHFIARDSSAPVPVRAGAVRALARIRPLALHDLDPIIDGAAPELTQAYLEAQVEAGLLAPPISLIKEFTALVGNAELSSTQEQRLRQLGTMLGASTDLGGVRAFVEALQNAPRRTRALVGQSLDNLLADPASRARLLQTLGTATDLAIDGPRFAKALEVSTALKLHHPGRLTPELLMHTTEWRQKIEVDCSVPWQVPRVLAILPKADHNGASYFITTELAKYQDGAIVLVYEAATEDEYMDAHFCGATIPNEAVQDGVEHAQYATILTPPHSNPQTSSYGASDPREGGRADDRDDISVSDEPKLARLTPYLVDGGSFVDLGCSVGNGIRSMLGGGNLIHMWDRIFPQAGLIFGGEFDVDASSVVLVVGPGGTTLDVSANVQMIQLGRGGKDRHVAEEQR